MRRLGIERAASLDDDFAIFRFGPRLPSRLYRHSLVGWIAPSQPRQGLWALMTHPVTDQERNPNFVRNYLYILEIFS